MSYAFSEHEDDTALSSELPLTGDLSAYVSEAARRASGDINFNTDETHLMHDLLLQVPIIQNHEEGAQIFCRHIARAALPVLKSVYAKSVHISIHISQHPIKPPDHIDAMAAYILFDTGEKEERQFIISPNQPLPDEKAMSAPRGIGVLCLPVPGDSRKILGSPHPGMLTLSLQMVNDLANAPDFVPRDRPALDLIIEQLNNLLKLQLGADILARRVVALLLEYSEDKDLSLFMRQQLRRIAQFVMSGGSPAEAIDRMYNRGGIGGPAMGPAPHFPGTDTGNATLEEENGYRLSDGTIVPVTMWAPGGRPLPVPPVSDVAAGVAAAAAAYVPPVAHYDTVKYPDQPHHPEETLNTWLPNPEGGADKNTVHYETAKYPDQPNYAGPPDLAQWSWNQSMGEQLVEEGPFKGMGIDAAIRDMWVSGIDPMEISLRLNVHVVGVIDRAKFLGLGPPGTNKPPVTQYADQQEYTLSDIADPAAEAPGYNRHGYAVQAPRPIEQRASAEYAAAAALPVENRATAQSQQTALSPVQNFSNLQYQQQGAAPVQNLVAGAALANPVYAAASAQPVQNLATQDFAAPAATPVTNVTAAAEEVGGTTPAPSNVNPQVITQTDIPPPEPAPAPVQEPPPPEPPPPEPERREEPSAQNDQPEAPEPPREAPQASAEAPPRTEPAFSPEDRAAMRVDMSRFSDNVVGVEAFNNPAPGIGLGHPVFHQALAGGDRVFATAAFHPSSLAALPNAPHHFGPLAFRPNGFYATLALGGLAAKPARTDSPASAPVTVPAARLVATAAKSAAKNKPAVSPQQAAYHNALLHSFPTPGLNLGPSGKRSQTKK